MRTEAEVTATPMNEKRVIVVGRPKAWPRIWARWSLAKRERSGMLSASVAQKPTMAVSEGTKKTKNSRPVWNLLGRARIGPRPPARAIAQPRSASPATIKNGAAQASSRLIELLPRTTIYMFQSQKAKKAIHTAPGTLSQTGNAVRSMVWIAVPPIQVWMPNQPQATRPRRIAGTLAPRVPKEARASTGKGMP